jgi:hypothetical protein
MMTDFAPAGKRKAQNTANSHQLSQCGQRVLDGARRATQTAPAAAEFSRQMGQMEQIYEIDWR